jgi:hypothetical protein
VSPISTAIEYPSAGEVSSLVMRVMPVAPGTNDEHSDHQIGID